MTTTRLAIIGGALATLIGVAPARANYFDLYFTGSGSATVDIFATQFGATTSSYSESGTILTDPNTGHSALCFALPITVVTGIVQIDNSSSAPVGAISFFLSGSTYYMGEYANIGGQLDQTANAGYVPTSGTIINLDASGNFIWEPGGSYRANNDYFGNISGTDQVGPGAPTVPDCGSTLTLLGCALTLAGAATRRFGK